MVVGDRNRTCGVDARWTGRQPECREINCSPPGVPEIIFRVKYLNCTKHEKFLRIMEFK